MATSIRNLLAAVDAETWGTTTSPYVADDAIHAMHHAARALDRLAYDGLDPAVGGHREETVHALAGACASLSQSWQQQRTARISDLVGAAADIAGQTRHDGNREDRWALATAFADTVRRLVDTALRHDPYRVKVELIGVANHARTIGHLAAVDPPPPDRRTLLDLQRSVPALRHSMPGSQVAAEAVIAATAILRTASTDHAGQVTILDADGCLHLAETMSHYAFAAASISGTPQLHRAAGTAAAWRSARHSLLPFDDSSRVTRPPSELRRWITRAHDGIRTACGPIARLDPASLRELPELESVVTHLRTISNQLPSIADQLTHAIHYAASTGRIRAPARAIEARLDRLNQRVANKPVMVALNDVRPALRAIHEAGEMAVTLAVTLDQAGRHIGRHPEPDLLAALAVRNSRHLDAEISPRPELAPTPLHDAEPWKFESDRCQTDEIDSDPL